jgi:hypothetical protein
MTTLSVFLSTILLYSVLSSWDKIMPTLTLVLIILLLRTMQDVTYSVLSLDEEKGEEWKRSNGGL